MAQFITETNRDHVHIHKSLIEKYLQYNNVPLVSEDIYWLHKPLCTFVSFVLIPYCTFVFYKHLSVDIVVVLNQSWRAADVCMKIGRHGFNSATPTSEARRSLLEVEIMNLRPRS